MRTNICRYNREGEIKQKQTNALITADNDPKGSTTPPHRCVGVVRSILISIILLSHFHAQEYPQFHFVWWYCAIIGNCSVVLGGCAKKYTCYSWRLKLISFFMFFFCYVFNSASFCFFRFRCIYYCASLSGIWIT